ncbi:UPF0481 protein At3g47200-like [Corylus avellana]|uniref:UPF0481 protein At3g47200-like n=1 Tax=Corylus avellana TaxID=13451 RepID=UPI00286CEA99|nr:UPF0481 protein At3g47200-like [Corylus avellana]
MEDRFSKSSHPSTVTYEKHCIFRLSRRLNNINGKSLDPQVVALGLGPYHHGKPQLQNMEELKWRWLASFMESKKGKLEECLIQLRPLEKEVRECYSETIKLSADELLQMMVVDGCFILMLFISARVNLDLGKAYMDLKLIYELDMVILPKIYRDLLLLENQIPSCVLKTLYKICIRSKSLFVIATKFFRSISVIPEFTNILDSLEWLHLLDLVRMIFISRRHNKEIRRTDDYGPFNLIPCVTKLRRAGIKVNRHMADSFLDVKFNNGVIEMPDINLNNKMCSLLVNCVAFEQYSCNIFKHFSIYAMLLDCLVNTARDVDHLYDRHVIDNFFGTDAETAQFINNLGKDLIINKDHSHDNDNSFLLELFGDVNKYYQKRMNNWGNWQWTSEHEYFGKPWLLISAFVGFVLLVLTFLQTFYTMYAYVHPKN